MKSRLKTALLTVALVGMLTPAVACDEYLYGFGSVVLGIDVYPGAFGGYYGDCCYGGYGFFDYDDDDDFFDDLDDFWDDFEDDLDDFFDD